MAQEIKKHLKENDFPLCTMCQNTLPHSHCKCPKCGNPDCVCEFENP
jgi:hypothetical protein